MPNPAMDSLSEKSNQKDIQDAISVEIELCMQEKGADPKACAGKAYGMARERTGQQLQSQK